MAVRVVLFLQEVPEAMSRSWKLLSLPVLVIILGTSLIGGFPARPAPVHAANCSPGNTGTLVIKIIDVGTGNPLTISGSVVLIEPDPKDFDLDSLVTDSDVADAAALPDKDNESGIIRFEGACATSGSEVYTVSLSSLPDGVEDCDILTWADATQLDEGATAQMQIEVKCAVVAPTPTPIPPATSILGLPAKVTVSASPLSVPCTGAGIVNVLILDAAGDPVQAGTSVAIASDLGSISPSIVVTAANGSAAAVFTAPASGGGTATIAAVAGPASGATTLAVNCVTEVLSTAPQANTGTAVITPPNTGDAGLAATAR
jgi:hypothetical protein